MAARRGNQSTYSGSVYDPKNKEARETDFRDFSDDDFIEAWKRACQRDRFEGLYDKLKEAKFPSVSLNCTDVRQALEFLHKATGDDVFRRAAHAMTRHGFTRGGVKLAALSKLSKRKHAIWAAMPRMWIWVEEEKFSPLKAAKLVAAQLGIPGRSFWAVITALRKTYSMWLKLNRPALELSGPTLRKATQ
jgi:hypothetical protein